MYTFLALSIVTFNFLEVFICVIVRSSHRAHFSLRTYFFHSLAVDLNACLHSLVLVVHFELSAVQCRLCSALFSSYVLLSHSCSGENKI